MDHSSAETINLQDVTKSKHFLLNAEFCSAIMCIP